MQNTDSSHDDGSTESCDAPEGGQGQTGSGSDSGGESGSQNAYDIPRYTSEGHVLGRPQEENNPQSAGNVQAGGQIPQPDSSQGAVPGAYQQQAPPQMQPQGMYNQVPPQQMQPQNVYQQNPAQPVYQQPVYQQPVYQQPVYQQNPYNTQYVPPYVNQQAPPPPEEQLEAGEKRHGQIMDVVNGIINGESPDVPKIIDLFESMDTRFWKGAMIGAGVVLLATNETVKKTIGDVLSGIMGKSGKTETEKGENNV